VSARGRGGELCTSRLCAARGSHQLEADASRRARDQHRQSLLLRRRHLVTTGPRRSTGSQDGGCARVSAARAVGRAGRGAGARLGVPLREPRGECARVCVRAAGALAGCLYQGRSHSQRADAALSAQLRALRLTRVRVRAAAGTAQVGATGLDRRVPMFSPSPSVGEDEAFIEVTQLVVAANLSGTNGVDRPLAELFIIPESTWEVRGRGCNGNRVSRASADAAASARRLRARLPTAPTWRRRAPAEASSTCKPSSPMSTRSTGSAAHVWTPSSPSLRRGDAGARTNARRAVG
jgi:hypothetical protein